MRLFMAGWLDRCRVCCRLLRMCMICFFFFKQKTAYEMRISDWSSDVCSSDLARLERGHARDIRFGRVIDEILGEERREHLPAEPQAGILPPFDRPERARFGDLLAVIPGPDHEMEIAGRSEEHTSELQSLMRISYAVFCLKKNTEQLKTSKH